MTVSVFPLAVFPYDVQCACFGDYHVYWSDRVNRVKNQKFDRHSGLLLSLKKPDNRDHKLAVRHFTQSLTALLATQAIQAAEFVIVPSHAEGKVSEGLTAIVKGVCMADRRFSLRSGSLARTKTIEKLSNGGNRSEAVHLSSLRFAPASFAPSTKILIDDIMTTGKSIAASARVIKQADPKAHVIAIVFGKTVHD